MDGLFVFALFASSRMASSYGYRHDSQARRAIIAQFIIMRFHWFRRVCVYHPFVNDLVPGSLFHPPCGYAPYVNDLMLY